MTATHRDPRISLIVGLVLLGSTAARSADVPIPGKLMIIKDGKLFKSISKSTSFPLPLPDSGSDPTANASSLQVEEVGGAGLLSESDLSTSLWRGLGTPAGIKGYVYTNTGAAAGANPVRKILLKDKVIKVIAKDDGTLDGSIAGDVRVVLTTGSDTYCARFGGTTVKNTADFVRRRDAAAPPDCSVPPPPVCGNGVIEPPTEECDDSGTSSGDGCDAACQLESVNPAVCAGVPTTGGTTLAMQLVAGTLEAPVHIAAPRLDPNRLFIVEQPGRIRVVRNGTLLAAPFLAIEGIVLYGGEQGLLSVAFHPDYETNGEFFVYYVNNGGDLVVSRFTVTGNPDDADETSEDIIVTVPHPGAGNHNGGQLAFGPDGFLYAGTGDGGGGCDGDENAQNDSSRLGKLLRIDVSTDTTTTFAKGLRNPFRLSFDRGTGDLYIGDVGQNMWEEIDYIPAPVGSGINYGWDFYEGTHCSADPPSNCGDPCPDPPVGLTMPVLEYDHGDGCSVTGGFVYRGCALPDLHGTYFYADYCAAFIRTFEGVAGGVAQNQADITADVDPSNALGNVSAFGEDARGELYIVDHASFAVGQGKVYRVVPGS